MLWASVLALIFSMRLDGGKDIHSVKSDWSVLHAEFKAHILLPSYVNIKEHETKTHTENTV